MRIISFLLTSLVLFAVVAVVGAFAVREALLIWATSMVQSSVTTLQVYAKNPKPYTNMCRQKGSVLTEEAVQRFQLRFTSPTTFATEVICNQFPLDPITLQQSTLPMFVQKDPGSGGLIWGTDRSGVVLSIFGRKTAVIVDNKDITTAAGNVSLGNVTPQTTCSGYGYVCCQSETVQGMGQSYGQVIDCPQTCFESCVPRPVVLSFVSDPYPEAGRTVTIHAGESVTFSYVISLPPGDKEPAQVTIEYGDGQRDQLAGINNQTSHTYACANSRCQFTAHASVEDAKGLKSADTPITTLNIVVTQ